jgi:hypothetical protein
VKRFVALVGLIIASCAALVTAICAAEPARAEQGTTVGAARAYGEWRIHVRPDKGSEYARLIESKGLPLFREAGGRMVGWWTTLVGDLYEHVTIWEYDDMTAFERAGAFLGKDKRFAEFVALRDPLLAGEESRFLELTDFALAPTLPEPAKVVVHEIHRVALAQKVAYLKFMQNDGLDLLKRNGFRAVGPWIVGVGNWREVTYLFCFESLKQREELLAAFAKTQEAQRYNDVVSGLVEEVTTRVLLPAPFTHAAPTGGKAR